MTDWRFEDDLAIEYDWRWRLVAFVNCDKQLYSGIYLQHFFHDTDMVLLPNV